jgi:hypothetical protein
MGKKILYKENRPAAELKENIGVYLDTNIYERLKIAAKNEDLPMSCLIRRLIVKAEKEDKGYESLQYKEALCRS